MRNLSRFMFAFSVLTLAGFVSGAIAQPAVMERPRTVRADVCPAPELVNAHIVLDPNHPTQTYSGPIMAAPNLSRLPGGGGASNTPTIIPDEPRDSDEVLEDFRQDYGLNVPASEFLMASLQPDGAVLCIYRSDVVEPEISIRTNATTCRSVSGSWAPYGGTQRCDASRRSCMFHCPN